MTKTVYEQQDAAFSNVSAFAVLNQGAHIASVSVKFPKDGAGRLVMFAHVLGTEMGKGRATGYGYDKRTAAARDAWMKLPRDLKPTGTEAKFWEVMSRDGGERWTDALRSAGFTVIQVI